MKLAAVATDVLGKSGREMLDALIGGELDAQAVLVLAPYDPPQIGFQRAGLQNQPHPGVLRQVLRRMEIATA